MHVHCTDVAGHVHNYVHAVNAQCYHMHLHCTLLHAGQEPDTEIIDMSVIDGALNYVLRNQRNTGELPIIGQVHSFRLFVSSILTSKVVATNILLLLLFFIQRSGGSLSHTAFGIVALKQYLQAFSESPNRVSIIMHQYCMQRLKPYLWSSVISNCHALYAYRSSMYSYCTKNTLVHALSLLIGCTSLNNTCMYQ